MTRQKICLKRYMAIILCILIMLSTMCSFVCISDMHSDNTQFFAARISLAFGVCAPHSLSSGAGAKIVTWIKKQDALTEKDGLSPWTGLDFVSFADKLLSSKITVRTGLYNMFRATRYFLRI